MNFNKYRILLLISIFCLGVMWWRGSVQDKVKVIFCDVGQGDGVIIIERDFQMLLDVGPDNGKMQVCLGKYMPFWDKTIEVAVISHNDRDHNGGLEGVRRNYSVQKIYSGELRQNDVIRYGQIDFDILSPIEITGDDNRDSVVGLLKYKDKKLLFLADAPMEVDQRLVWRGVLRQAWDGSGVEVLKVAHHGSAEGTSKELVEAIKPKLAIISVGKNNKYGHPNEELLKRLEGIRVWRTDKQGDLMVSLD